MSKEDNKTAIALRLRAAREASGLSQGQVARKLGFHRPTISEIEAGRRRVNADELSLFGRLYGVRVSWLACEDSEGIADPDQDRIQLAARKLTRMNRTDLKRLLEVLSSLDLEDGTE